MNNKFFNNNKETTEEINCFSGIFDREIKRFLDSMDISSKDITTQLLSNDKYKDHIDYKNLSNIHLLCTAIAKVGLDFLELHLPNFFKKNKKEMERSPYNIYSSGVRKIVTHFSTSYLVQKVIPLFKLGDVLDVTEIYKNQTADFLKYFELFSKDLEKYLTNLDKGAEIAKSLDKANNGEKDYSSELTTRLYASLKTWITEEEFNDFLNNFENFLDTGIELIIVSPFELYLKIGKEGVIVIWKMLTAKDQNELLGKSQLEDLVNFSNHLYDNIKEETNELGILYEIRRLFKTTIQNYLNDFKIDQKSMRDLVTSKNKRKEFIHKFEKGTLLE